jgi:hypothetical protein
MGYFDDIVPPDSAPPGGYSPLRITVRPKSVELPPGPGNALRTAADASDEQDKAPPARAGLFDDVVPSAGAGSTPRFPADASKETDDAPQARNDGLFDDIVPPAPQATGPVAALNEAEIPQIDPMTGMPMPAAAGQGGTTIGSDELKGPRKRAFCVRGQAAARADGDRIGRNKLHPNGHGRRDRPEAHRLIHAAGRAAVRWNEIREPCAPGDWFDVAGPIQGC